MVEKAHSEFGFSKPALYQIEVLGELSTDWAERLRGMDVVVKAQEDAKPISVLTGKVRDQAALAGILNTLYEYHLTLIYLKKLKNL